MFALQTSKKLAIKKKEKKETRFKVKQGRL